MVATICALNDNRTAGVLGPGRWELRSANPGCWAPSIPYRYDLEPHSLVARARAIDERWVTRSPALIERGVHAGVRTLAVHRPA